MVEKIGNSANGSPSIFFAQLVSANRETKQTTQVGAELKKLTLIARFRWSQL